MSQPEKLSEAFKAFKEDLASEYRLLRLEAKSQKQELKLVSINDIKIYSKFIEI